jgi:hypothetical protein
VDACKLVKCEVGLVIGPRVKLIQALSRSYVIYVHRSVHLNYIYIYISNEMQQWAVYILYFTAKILYMFRVPFTPIIRSTGTVVLDHWYKSYVTIGWTVWLATYTAHFVGYLYMYIFDT